MTLILDEVDLCHSQKDQDALVQAAVNLREQAETDDGVREVLGLIIRVLDTACARNIDIGRAVLTKHEYNTTRSHKHGGKLA